MSHPTRDILRLLSPNLGRRVTLSAQMYHLPEAVRRESSSPTELVRRRGALLRAPPATLAEYATLRAGAFQGNIADAADAAMVSMMTNDKTAASAQASPRVSSSPCRRGRLVGGRPSGGASALPFAR